MVISWILNLMSKDLVEAFISMNSVRELWLELLERYGESNGPLVYKL